MRRVLVLAAAAVALTLPVVACQSAGEPLSAKAPEHDAKCKDMGYSPGTALYLQCRQYMSQVAAADAAQQQQRQREARTRLLRFGQALGGNLPEERRVTCHQNGSTTECRSWQGPAGWE
ncbi:hypothetical protein ABEG18_22075 [Alsobacter sp. KACC 23698]|uniref:Lipoprotein n=1 Tax=Alsobacter sp. KACC 23698 TaxID=3149229 RepID=A0AAU7JDI0_9HYPH